MMVYKLAGAAAVIISSGMYGIIHANTLHTALMQLKDLRTCLAAVKSEIHLCGVPLGRAMENASCVMTTDLKTLMKDCGKSVSTSSGNSLKEELMSRMCEPSVKVSDEGKSIIFHWASSAGTGDRQSECDSLTFALSQFDELIVREEEECAKKMRLYRGSGFLIGAFVVAVLI